MGDTDKTSDECVISRVWEEFIPVLKCHISPSVSQCMFIYVVTARLSKKAMTGGSAQEREQLIMIKMIYSQ